MADAVSPSSSEAIVVSADGPSSPKAAWTVIILIGLFALLVRLYYVNTVVVDMPVRGDARDYYCYAYNIIHHGVFSKVHPGVAVVPDSYRDPVYPVVLAGAMLAGGEDSDRWYPLLLNLQALLSAATVMLAMIIGRGWMRLRWLVCAGLLMALWPHSIVAASYILIETVFGFLVSLGMLLVFASLGKRPRWSFFAGCALGLAALTNAIFVPVGGMLAAILICRKRISWQCGLALLLGSMLLPIMWSARNAMIDTDPAASASGRAMQNFVQGSWPEYHSAWRANVGGDMEAMRTLGKHNAQEILNEIDAESLAMMRDPLGGAAVVAHRISRDPWRYVRWYFSKSASIWGWSSQIGDKDVYIFPVERSAYISNGFYRATVALAHAMNPWCSLLLAMCCAWVAIRFRSMPVDVLAVAALIAYVTTVYTLLQAEPRYSVAFRAFEFLMIGMLLSIVDKWRSAQTGKLSAESKADAFRGGIA